MNTGPDKPRHDSDAANLPNPTTSERRRDVESAIIAKGGLLVVGHGTRDARGIEEFYTAVERIGEKVAPLAVEGCFLELAEPTIDEAVDKLVAAGVRRITVAPLILFAAGHAKRDIPDAVATAVARHVGVEVRQLPHLGCRAELIALSARRYREAIRDLAEVAPEQTLLLLVGRGSRDDEATAEMHRLAKLRAAATPIGRLEVAFTAMAEPRLEAAIEVVARLPFRRVVVQPHLLFIGELLERVRATVAQAADRCADKEWIVAGHLGPEAEIADAVRASLTTS